MNLKTVLLVIISNAIITLAIVFGVQAFVSDRSLSVGESDSSYQFSRDESTLIDLVEEVNPAVLSIIVSQDVPVYEQFLREFGPFGFSIPDRREVGREERQIGSGSGFVLNPDGLVVTNRHVVSVDDADYVGIDYEGNQYELRLIERDPMLDVAVLEIVEVPDDLVYLEFGDSDDLRLGQSVVAIGNALGEFSNSVSTGIISGLSRSIVAGNNFSNRELLENVIQTDAAINPGNSGGPLLNFAGEVIGVNVAVAQGSENIGFSIPSNIVADIVSSIETEGRIVRPYLGVRYIMMTEAIANEFELDIAEGALVIGSGQGFAVDPNSPAAEAGVREGDVITQVNNIAIGTNQSLGSALRQQPIGQRINIAIVRNGDNLGLSVVLEEFVSN